MTLAGVRALPSSWSIAGQGVGVWMWQGEASGEEVVRASPLVAFPLAAEVARAPVELPYARAAAGPEGASAGVVASPAAVPHREGIGGIGHGYRTDAPVMAGADRCRLHCVYRL